MARGRSEPYPALAASVLLHLAVLAAALIAARYMAKPITMGDVTTVTLVTSADVANLRRAEQSPTKTDAATPTPVPDAQVQAAMPAPQPAPPPAPAPPATARPAPMPVPQKTPAKPAPSAAPDPFLSNLQRTLGGGGGRPLPGPKGSSQPTARPTPGSGAGDGQAVSPADVAGLTTALEKAWILSCDDLGGANINVDVSFSVGATGYIQGKPVATPPNTLAARRAIDAVYKLEPFKDFRGLYGHTVPKVHFNAKEACAKR